MTILKYSMPLTPPAPPARHERAYPEFRLALAPRWRELPATEGSALAFESDADGATLAISTELLATPDEQATASAEQLIDRGMRTFQAAQGGQARLLQQRIQPHASGAGLEVSYIVEAAQGPLCLHLGYVTARKRLSFTMTCRPGRQAAVALFNATVPGFRPRLP